MLGKKKFSLKGLFSGGGSKVLAAAESIIPTFLKDHGSKLSSKRIFKVMGGGSLLTIGAKLTYQSAESQNELGVWAGLGLCGVGAIIGIMAGSFIKETQKSTNEKNKIVDAP